MQMVLRGQTGSWLDRIIRNLLYLRIQAFDFRLGIIVLYKCGDGALQPTEEIGSASKSGGYDERTGSLTVR
jgi:hypothetical protein